MPRNPHYDILFQPVRIGPVTAPNRFYQVPHASGMTNAAPRTRAAFRATKAEGGWGVVCTGACSIHPSSDDTPLPTTRLWDEADIRSHALMTEAVHRHGALAGVELWHGGGSVMNRASRTAPISPSGTTWMPPYANFMSHLRSRAMDKTDIANLIRWQGEAAARAVTAGFDIVYVYAGMGYLPYEFLLPDWNQRTDDYGGSVANRTRLVAQLLEATHDATKGRAAVALRISLEELRKRPGTHAESEAHEVVAALAELPDLWDVKMDSSPTDCGASRFRPEGSHEPVIDFVKSLTTKPVVGVGRFTSPDTMVSQIKRGVLDLIGGARPSIADPFLPRKIAEGREDEIRECIGCNICISSWHDGVPVRCTQNPSAGEEWRRGWHPERMAPRRSDDSILIVGGGPAGLEAALSLARRGHHVTVADAAPDLGGRLRFEATLPGLSQWRRVIDYRLGRLRQMANVELYPASPMDADAVLGFGAAHVALATGARWTRRLWSLMELPAGELDHPSVYTPDDLAAGTPLQGPVLVYDYDNYVMGGLVAEHLAGQGLATTYATPAGHASAWTLMSNELPGVHLALHRAGIARHTLVMLTGFDGAAATLADIFTGAETRIPAASVVIVGARRPNDALHQTLLARSADWGAAGIASVTPIGDAHAPGSLVHAIHFGHRYAEDLGSDTPDTWRLDAPFAPVGLT